MADGHHVLLFWFYILRLCLPLVLFVSVSRLPSQRMTLTDYRWTIFSRTTTATACVTAVCSKSPRSRTAKQTTSGSSSSPLSCFWYVSHFTLCTVAISLSSLTLPAAGPIPALQPSLPLLAARLRADLLLVPPTPLHTHLALRSGHHHRAIPSLCTCRVLMGAERHVACRSERSCRLRRWPRRLVHS